MEAKEDEAQGERSQSQSQSNPNVPALLYGNPSRLGFPNGLMVGAQPGRRCPQPLICANQALISRSGPPAGAAHPAQDTFIPFHLRERSLGLGEDLWVLRGSEF